MYKHARTQHMHTSADYSCWFTFSFRSFMQFCLVFMQCQFACSDFVHCVYIYLVVLCFVVGTSAKPASEMICEVFR